MLYGSAGSSSSVGDDGEGSAGPDDEVVDGDRSRITDFALSEFVQHYHELEIVLHTR
jgi:hypothetical protein